LSINTSIWVRIYHHVLSFLTPVIFIALYANNGVHFTRLEHLNCYLPLSFEAEQFLILQPCFLTPEHMLYIIYVPLTHLCDDSRPLGSGH
jgi:hypothetical protein